MKERIVTQHVIETRALTKRYGEAVVAVKALDLRVRRGEVYGFLGPNGAGKTTTLRMLLGLIRPTSGSAVVLGAAPGSPNGLSRIGALIETPTFYPFLSGRDNLRVLARYAGVPETRIAADQAERLVATFEGVEQVARVDGGLRIAVDPGAAAAINRALVEAGVAVGELRAERSSLEKIFLQLTHEEKEAA